MRLTGRSALPVPRRPTGHGVWFPFPFLWALLNNAKEFLEPLTLPGLGAWFLHLLEAYLKFCLAYVNQLVIPYRFATTFLVHGLKKASEDWL